MENEQPIKRKKRKRKNSFMGYVYLFIFVFIAALTGLSHLVNSYTPEVDVSIGNQEVAPLTKSDMDVEVKSVDERLKWIQMEDEMPSVAIREAKEATDEILKEKEKKSLELEVNEEPIFKKSETIPMPTMSEIKETTVQLPSVGVPISSNFRTASSSSAVVPLPVSQSQNLSTPIIPAPIPSLTKVYLGSFSTVDEAMSMQQKIATDIPDSMPFIKSMNGSYIVQLGSFSNPDLAQTFIQRVRDKGYNPKIVTNN